MVDSVKYVWMNGELVPWENAQVHLLTHALHYGLGVFEGIRAYESSGGKTAIFRLPEHIRRLFNGAKILGLEVPCTPEQVKQACRELVAKNGLPDAYLRPVIFSGAGRMGVYAPDNPVQVAIATWKWGAYLGDEGLTKGIRVKISTFTRSHINSWLGKAKTCGAYVNSTLAKREAVLDGYDEAILLDNEGYVAEGSGENVFMVSDGTIYTAPPPTVLAGITRATVIQLAREAGYDVVERRFTRDELYIADEAFFTGTAAEITPIREVDRRVVGSGKPGPITQKIQKTFFSTVRGDGPHSEEWLTYVS